MDPSIRDEFKVLLLPEETAEVFDIPAVELVIDDEDDSSWDDMNGT
jgi:hypothetical protein